MCPLRASTRAKKQSSSSLTIRRVATAAEFAACVRMQYDIWGADFTEAVPAAIMKVSQKIGGVTAGAFDSKGTLLGFVFGMTGVQNGRLVHWSDLLAVDPAARNKGLGQSLKKYQRELLLPLGVETMYWTYDPLVAKNAYLNIVKLGARAAEYVVDMYGSATESPLFGAIGTDRFVVAWDLTAERGGSAQATGVLSGPAGRYADAPVVNSIVREDGAIDVRAADLVDAPLVRVEIPADIEQIITRDSEAALKLREVTRRAFSYYMGSGYEVIAFSHRMPEDRYYYVLSKKAD